MKWSLATAVLVCNTVIGSSAFVPQSHGKLKVYGKQISSKCNSMAFFNPSSDSLSSSAIKATVTESNFDTVTVDLADGRDYPIYIGAKFSDEEGALLKPMKLKSQLPCIIVIIILVF